MSDWVAAISGGSAILGAAVGGSLTYLSGRSDQRQRDRAELTAALAEFGHALDALQVEIARLPRSTRFSNAVDTAINEQRMPHLTFLLNWTYSHTFGRDAQRAVEKFMSASNRLILVAPPELIPALERSSTVLSQVSTRGPDWDQQFLEMRGELTVASRSVLGSGSPVARSVAAPSQADASAVVAGEIKPASDTQNG